MGWHTELFNTTVKVARRVASRAQCLSWLGSSEVLRRVRLPYGVYARQFTLESLVTMSLDDL